MNKKILYVLFATFLLTNSINSQVDKTWTGLGSESQIPLNPNINTNAYTNGDNWSPSGVPADIDNITIPNVTNQLTADDDVTFGTMTIESGASFTSEGTVDGDMIIQSGATFINEGTVTGTIIYKRTLSEANNWHLMSSPVIGETIEGIKEQNKLATNNANIGFASYTNRNTNPWIYETAAVNNSVLPLGKGYSIKLKEDLTVKDVSFTGSVGTADITYNRSSETGSVRNNYLLVGNPFTAYMNAVILLTGNLANFTEQTLWIWDGTTSTYVTYNNTDIAFELAPTQGFFVDLNGDGSGGSITFTKSNQSHQTTDTFTKQEPYSTFELFVENESAKSATKVFYIDGKTTGYDNGYDSKMFGGVEYGFSVFTELVSDNEGKYLAIQTLPKNDTSIIPVGMIANAGEEITFSIESTNLPEGASVSLEDKKTGVFTNLSESTYTTTLTEAAKGVGQFYIHTAGKALNTNDLNIENISVYKSSSNEITITGLNTEATFTMFSLLGKQVLQTKVAANGVNKVNLPSLSAGIYIVKLNSSLGTITKKITLNQQ
jgi:hypothetical protein